MKNGSAKLTQLLIIALLVVVPLTSGLDAPAWIVTASMAACALLAVVLVALRWNERGPDGRREPALRWHHALFFAAAGGAMWLAFAAESTMARVGAVLALGMLLLAAVDVLRVRRVL